MERDQRIRGEAAGGRQRLRVGLLTALAGLALAGCADPAPDPQPEPSPTPIICEEHARAYERLTRRLSPEEFLSRVVEEDLERVGAILYPEGHTRAGEFIPVAEWGEAQLSAWGVYITTRGNLPAGLGLC